MTEDRDQGTITDKKLFEELLRLGRRYGRVERIDEASLRKDNGGTDDGGLLTDATGVTEADGPGRPIAVATLPDGAQPPAPRMATTGAAAVPALAPAEAAAPGTSEGHVIPLDIAASLADVRERENLSVSIAGVPASARLSVGSPAPYGAWQVAGADLDDLALVAPTGLDETVTLFVTATAGADRKTTVARLAVSVEPLAEVIDVAAGDTATSMAEPIALDIAGALADLLGRDGLSIHVAGVPKGARLSAGTTARDGLWILDPSDLDGLTIALPTEADEVSLIVSALAPPADGLTTPRVLARLVVEIQPEAAAPQALR
jgi:hypothetical protein